MGTTKLRARAKSLLLFRKGTKLAPGAALMEIKGKLAQNHFIVDDLFREGLGQHLDAHLETSLDKNAELIVSRKIEEEAEDNLALILK